MKTVSIILRNMSKGDLILDMGSSLVERYDEKCNVRNNKIRCSGQVEHKESGATLQME